MTDPWNQSLKERPTNLQLYKIVQMILYAVLHENYWPDIKFNFLIGLGFS